MRLGLGRYAGCHGSWTSCENQLIVIGAAFFVQGVGSLTEGWTWGLGHVVATFWRLRFVMLAVHIEAAAEWLHARTHARTHTGQTMVDGHRYTVSDVFTASRALGQINNNKPSLDHRRNTPGNLNIACLPRHPQPSRWGITNADVVHLQVASDVLMRVHMPSQAHATRGRAG